MGENPLPKALAEAIGTFALIFIGAGAILTDAVTGAVGLVGIALAHGLTIAAMGSATGHISGGHLNPAVTVAAMVTQRLPAGLGALYIVAQLAGGAAAAFVLKEAFAPGFWEKASGGATLPGNGFTPLAAFYVETILTFFLVFVVFGTAMDSRGPKIGALAIGGTVALDILMAGPLTGASMNPARSFGPALIGGFWHAHWAYWAGPILGAVAAALLYDKVVGKAP